MMCQGIIDIRIWEKSACSAVITSYLIDVYSTEQQVRGFKLSVNTEYGWD